MVLTLEVTKMSARRRRQQLKRPLQPMVTNGDLIRGQSQILINPLGTKLQPQVSTTV